MVFLATHIIYDAYKMLSQMDKWHNYMADVDTIISPLHHVKNPDEKIAAIMTDVGFCKFEVKLLQKSFDYDSLEVFKGRQS